MLTTNGVILITRASEAFRSAAYISDFVQSNEPPAATPFNIAFNTDATIWAWFERPENALRLRRFTAAITKEDSRRPGELFTAAEVHLLRKPINTQCISRKERRTEGVWSNGRTYVLILGGNFRFRRRPTTAVLKCSKATGKDTYDVPCLSVEMLS